MRLPDDRPAATPRRLVLVAAFLLVTGLTAVAFAQAVTGHLAAMHAPSADVTVTDYEVTDDGLDVTLRVHNPTGKDLVFGTAQVNAYVGGEQATDGTTASLDDAAVPAESTSTLTVPLDLRDGSRDSLRNADPGQVEVQGRLKAYVVDELVYVSVDGMEVGE